MKLVISRNFGGLQRKIKEIEMTEANQDNVVVFNNLIEAGGQIGNTSKIAAIMPSADSFVASNAKGTMRTISSLDEIGEIADVTAKALRSAFA